jgi:hypothetical protein
VLEAPSWIPAAAEEQELTEPRAVVASQVSTRAEASAEVGDELAVDRGLAQGTDSRTDSCCVSMPPPPSGFLKCSVLYDGDVLPYGYRVVLVTQGSREQAHFRSMSGRTVRFDELKPGNATLTVVPSDSTFELARIENIQIPETGETSDPRLNPIDLRDRVHCIRGRLLDDHEVPWASFQVRLEDGANHHATVRTHADGWFSVDVPLGITSLQVVASHFQRTWFADRDTVHLVHQ